MATKRKKQPATPSRKKKRATTKAKTTTATPPAVAAAAPQPANGDASSPSNGDVLRKLYASLLRCRMAEEHARGRSRPDEPTQFDLAIGHEAVVVGTTVDLRDSDAIAASGRNLAAQVVRQDSLKGVLASNGHASRANGSAITAAESGSADPFNLGTGIALAHQLEHKGNVVIALCAEQSPSLERWHEAMKFAGTHKLPVIYVIKTVAPDGKASSNGTGHLEELSFMARGMGFPGIVVDGHDVVAVWRVAQESIHRARNGSGPTLIECRMDSTHEPLAHMEHYLKKRNTWDEGWRDGIAGRLREEILKAASSF
jgi:TPP-dependent pyruvate/acetoin dehydrogenase alpha subunit